MSHAQMALVTWGVSEVCAWLETCRPKLGAKTEVYQQLMVSEDIDGEILVDMGHQEMTSLGITSFGHRHYLLKCLGALKAPGQIEGAVRDPSAGVMSMLPPPPRQGHNFGGVDVSSGWSSSTKAWDKPKLQAVSNLSFRDDTMGPTISRAAMPRLHTSTARIHESKVTIGRKIGSGSVGHVYAGKYEQHPVAIKQHRLDGSQLDAKAMVEFEIEVGKMTAVNHPCIVRCFGMLEPTPGIVLELVDGGSLFQIIHARRDESFSQYEQRLPWPVRMRYLLDSMYGLRAVHEAGLIHGDFKTLNMLVGPDHRVKVGDFGLSKCLGAMTVLPGTRTITGTPQYMAPEVMQSLPQGMRVDIYSLSIVMWELLTGEIPWRGLDIVQIIQQVTLKANETVVPPPGRPPLLNHHLLSAPAGYIQLMQGTWAHFPSDRPSTDTCVQQLESIQMSHGLYSGTGRHAPAAQEMPGNWPYNRASAVEIDSSKRPDKRPRMTESGVTIPAQYTALMNAPMGAPQPTRANQWHPASTTHPDRFGGKSVEGEERSTSESNSVEGVVDMLNMQGNDSGQEAAAKLVFEACAHNPGNQDKFAKAPGDGIAAMVSLLNRVDRPELQSKAAQAIAAACGSNSMNRLNTVQCSGIKPLVHMLQSHHAGVQENAANALANVIKTPKGALDDFSNTLSPEEHAAVEKAGLKQLHEYGGIVKLVELIGDSLPRVKEAATAALANAMEDSPETRDYFQKSGGVELVVNLLRSGDPHAQENATTALWNSMVDNDASRADLIKFGGIPPLIQQLIAGTAVGQELAAGAIWKACSNDPQIKHEISAAIPGLVALLRNGTVAAKEHAAGAIRSACINSAENKEQLWKYGGVSFLTEVIRKGSPGGQEQAGAALANACAGSSKNQSAARKADAIKVLVNTITSDKSSTQLVECSIAAVRNICVNNRENQEELGRCGGIDPVLKYLLPEHRALTAGSQLLEYAAGAMWKACTHCEPNREIIRKHLPVLERLVDEPDLPSEARKATQSLIPLLQRDYKEEQISSGSSGGILNSMGSNNQTELTTLSTMEPKSTSYNPNSDPTGSPDVKDYTEV